jgi:GT2 family glycosyltransferase
MIEKHPNCGVFTCKTNAHHSNTGQQDVTAPKGDNLSEHQDHAKKVWEEFGYSASSLQKISGFFMLINKKAWEKVGGFPGKAMFKEDWDFTRKVGKNGYKLLIINGLYVYHLKKRTGTWIENEKTTKEIKALR